MMSKLLDDIKHTVDATIPDKEELTHGAHPKIDYTMLIFRNLLVSIAAVLFLLSFFLHDIHNILRAGAYFCGAGAYLLECLAVTDCFQHKVPHTEMFMVYCFGPLYLMMGLSYLLGH